MLNGLDLFSGIGGLTVALSDYVVPVAYCEQDPYCQAVLVSRMHSGNLPIAPIWDDVRTLRGSQLAGIDIIYGGFPCQDISVAGNGKGLEGERSGLVFEVLRLVEECEAPFVFLENVPAIRHRGAERIIKELAGRGYDARWIVVSAADVGAPHLRKRWFMLASHAERLKLRLEQQREPGRPSDGVSTQRKAFARDDGSEKPLADSGSVGFEEQCQAHDDDGTQSSGYVADRRGSVLADSASERLEGKREVLPRLSGWWEAEPDVGRVVDGVPNRVDRIRGLGNAVVPLQAREAFKRLMGL